MHTQYYIKHESKKGAARTVTANKFHNKPSVALFETSGDRRSYEYKLSSAIKAL